MRDMVAFETLRNRVRLADYPSRFRRWPEKQHEQFLSNVTIHPLSLARRN
jgi:hypothetical protein